MFNFLKNTSYTFEGKKAEESVVLFLHRHWYVLTGKVTTILVMSLVPILFLIVFGQLILANQLIPLFTFLWAAYIMALWFYLFYALTMYTLDYWIITNERIVDSKQMGFFNRRISELSIHMIQDISVKLVGLIPTMLNFGTVEVQTAAEQRNFLFDQIPKPQIAKDKIMEIIEATEDELGPRMHGMTQRHQFHPDKYVIQRISEHTKDKIGETESNISDSSNQNIGDSTDKESQLKKQIEWQEERDSSEIPQNTYNKPNNIPPNLPL